MGTEHVFLDIQVRSLAVLVTFNGVPIMREQVIGGVSRANRLNGWVVSGANGLQAHLAALSPPPAPVPGRPAPADSPPPRREPYFRLSLRAGPAGPPAALRTLFDYEWDPELQPLTPGATTAAISTSIVLAPVAAWTWAAANPVPQLAPADAREIRAVLSQLHQALLTGAINETIRLQRVQIQELSVAVGEDPVVQVTEYQSFLAGRLAASWSVDPLRPELLQYIPVAGARLHHVQGPQAQPAILARSALGPFAIDPYFAKLGGRWMIVR